MDDLIKTNDGAACQDGVIPVAISPSTAAALARLAEQQRPA